MKVALFAVGLRDNSRIKMKINGAKCSFETLLIASAVDKLGMIAWLQSSDGANNTNRPKSIVAQLMGDEKKTDIVSFATPEDFEKERNRILGEGGN